MAGMVSRQCGMRNAECGMSGEGQCVSDLSLQFRIPHSTLHSKLPHDETRRSRLSLARGRESRGSDLQGTDFGPLVGGRLDTGHARIADGPRHGFAAHLVALGISERGNEEGRIAYDQATVDRRRHGDGRNRARSGHDQLCCAALTFTRSRDGGGPLVDGAEHHLCPHRLLDPGHARVTHAPCHGPAVHWVPSRVSEDHAEAHGVTGRDRLVWRQHADRGHRRRSGTSAAPVVRLLPTLVSLLAHVTIRPQCTRSSAARRRAEKKTPASPAGAVSFGGDTVTEATGGGAITTSCAVPLLPSLVAVTTADPGFAGRNAACGPYEDTIRATLVSLMVHVTIRPESCRPWASRSVAEKKTLSSPTTTVSAGGVTLTEATGGGAVTTSCAEALLPSLMAVMVVVPRWSPRTTAVGGRGRDGQRRRGVRRRGVRSVRAERVAIGVGAGGTHDRGGSE